jgi:hypothetical protein
MRWNTVEQRAEERRWSTPEKRFAYLPMQLEDGSYLWWEHYWTIYRIKSLGEYEYVEIRRSVNREDFGYAERT